MSPLVERDGRDLRGRYVDEADVVVVGSGPAGAAVARNLAHRGVRVLVLEEGHEARPADFAPSAVRAMASLYRDMGTSLAFGNAPMPYLQARVVGGTSVVNGAISWRFPREALDEWIAADPAIGEGLRYEAIAAAEARIEERLHVAPTDVRVAGPKNLLLARGADALGVAHRAIRRNVRGCTGEGRCLQGCPHGHKLSMDLSFLPDAVGRGARILAGMRVDRVIVERGRARGVAGVTAAGARFEVRAKHAVVLAASAIQTPCVLRRSGLPQGGAGDGLAAHPGVSVTGRFAEPVRNWRGATQGHEVIGYRGEGIKLEALGFDVSLLASRIPGVGRDFARRLAEIDRYAVWGAALRARGRGKVRPGPTRPIVTYSLTDDDVRKARRAVRLLGDVMLAAGALEVYPGIPGFDPAVRDRAHMARIEAEGSLAASDYTMSMTHLFGTARMGSDPARSVVRPDFRHHATDALYVADSSVFPGNLGVNPQIAIMALADLCADRVAVA
ncbi:MAG: GMC family oxidoreductase [Deltaproteobacteria bacterium]|nr:GMC family oxidoreductase [Deltaproteobacteria bacterium]